MDSYHAGVVGSSRGVAVRCVYRFVARSVSTCMTKDYYNGFPTIVADSTTIFLLSAVPCSEDRCGRSVFRTLQPIQILINIPNPPPSPIACLPLPCLPPPAAIFALSLLSSTRKDVGVNQCPRLHHLLRRLCDSERLFPRSAVAGVHLQRVPGGAEGDSQTGGGDSLGEHRCSFCVRHADTLRVSRLSCMCLRVGVCGMSMYVLSD